MRYKKLLENVDRNIKSDVDVRRYSLSEMISESYKSLYKCKENSNMRSLVEAHIADVKENPTEIDRLSRQLCNINHLIRMVESGEVKDFDLLVPEKKYSKVVPDKKELEESCKKRSRLNKKSTDMEESCKKESLEDEEEEDLLEETELTDEEVEELAKHLEEIRKNKKVSECGAKKSTNESSINEESKGTIQQIGVDILFPEDVDARSTESNIAKVLQDAGYEVLGCMFNDGYWTPEEYGLGESKKSTNESKKAVKESKSYDNLNLLDFSKKSSSKAFVKTFKKLNSKLHEGTALTRQESIALYKAANSAMTHLSVELEHNPEFLDTFKESVSLLSIDVDKLLGSLKEGKAPSKATMKSLAKFSEAILREEDEEDLPPIEDEEDSVSEESEEFDQEYADARVELHKELVDEHSDSEDPEVQEKLAQDAEEVVSLPGITDEQIAEIEGEGPSEDPEDEGDEEEDVEDADESTEVDIDDEITDDELEELKKHLKEMRKASKNLSENAKVGDTIVVNRDEEYYKDHGYKVNEKGYVVKKVENYGVFISGYKYLIPHSDYKVINKE